MLNKNDFIRVINSHNNPSEFLIEIIDSYIKELNNIKQKIQIEEQLKDNPNKDKIIKNIDAVFEIINNFEEQRKL